MNSITIEITVLIAIVSVSAAVFFGIKGHQRARKKDEQDEASRNTAFMIKLETLSLQMTELKAEIKAEFQMYRNDHDKIIVIERDVKTLWNAVDKIKIKTGG